MNIFLFWIRSAKIIFINILHNFIFANTYYKNIQNITVDINFKSNKVLL